MVEAMAAGVPIEPLARYFEYWLLRLQGVYRAGSRGCRTRRGRFWRRRGRAARLALGDVPVSPRDAARARSGASRADRDASREGSEVGARAAGDAAKVIETTMTFQGLILKLSEFWASRGCVAAAAARRRGRRRHDASGDVPARARARRTGTSPTCSRRAGRPTAASARTRTGCSSTISFR